ncbi:MAG TPA: molybdenum cofactor guanylyltransferase [Acidobacteriaceae bacterium]|nr:molybdenum cofactor guanylyltransferase [Acidobacteriaceae bacterium]
MNAFVLAGGASSRMGRDKALLDFGGRPLIEHALALLRSLNFEPRICGSRLDLARFAPVVPDNHPGCGPLAGIEAALSISGSDLNLFLPVDLPLLPIAFLRWMVERATTTDTVATVPLFGGRPQPLCAVYTRRLVHGIHEALAAGQYKMMTAIETAASALGEPIDAFHVESVAAALIPETWPAHPPVQQWFRNINTPADYEQLLSHLEQKRAFQ